MHNKEGCVMYVTQAGYAEKMANVWEKVAEETSGYAKDGS